MGHSVTLSEVTRDRTSVVRMKRTAAELRKVRFRDFAIASGLPVGDTVTVLECAHSGQYSGEIVRIVRAARSLQVRGMWADEGRMYLARCADWPTSVSGVVDVFPVFSPRGVYNGKYKAKCFKYQLVVDIEGVPVAYSGPHNGATHDSKLWQSTAGVGMRHYANEVFVGDLAYIGQAHILTKLKRGKCKHDTPDRQRVFSKANYKALTKKQKKAAKSLCDSCKFYNKFVDHVRGRVEHTNARLKIFSDVRECKSRRMIRACVPIVIEYVAWRMRGRCIYRDSSDANSPPLQVQGWS